MREHAFIRSYLRTDGTDSREGVGTVPWKPVGLIAWAVLGSLLARPTPAVAQDMPAPTVERVKHATVMVWTFASKRQKADTPLGTGSGYFINSTGLLITNNHVVDPAHGRSLKERQKFQYETNRLSYKVITDSGTKDEKIWECDLLHQSVTADQAMLQARDADGEKLASPEYLRLLPSWRLRERTKVCAAGFPGGNSQRTGRTGNARVALSTGVVTKVPRAASGRIRRVETNVVARRGNSGGPMVDFNGSVVGTVTLLGQTQDQANTCTLVPSTLTRAFIRDAVKRERMPSGSDYAPLFDILAESDSRLNLPEFQRLPDKDVLFYENDERVYGTIEDEVITWKSPLGRFQIPTDAIAYVIRDQENQRLVLEGGNHIYALRTAPKFQFNAGTGSATTKRFDRIPVVGFRSKGPGARRAGGSLTLFESDLGRMALINVEGKAKFKSRAGVSEHALADIVQIESEPAGNRQVVVLTDGRKLTGRFQDSKYRATLAATDTPVEFDLSKVDRAYVRTVDGGTYSHGGLTLLGALSTSDPELLEIARILERGDCALAREKLTPWLDRKRLTKMPAVSKSRVRLLDGMISLRAGDPNPAGKIRKCARAKDPNIAAYAQGCVAVLKRFKTDFQGKPLSDPDVLADAGLALGGELIRKARDTLKDRKMLQGKKGEYHRYMNKIQRHEKSMVAAAVFAGPDADDVLIELWKFAMELGDREYSRLVEDYHKMTRGQRRVSVSVYNELEKIRKKARKVADNWNTHYVDLANYGFHYAESLDEEDFGD